MQPIVDRGTLTATPTPQLGQGQRGSSCPCDTGRDCRAVDCTVRARAGTECVGTVAVPARAPAAAPHSNAADATDPLSLKQLDDTEYPADIGSRVGADTDRSDSAGSDPIEHGPVQKCLVDLIDRLVETDCPVSEVRRTFARSPRSAGSRSLSLWSGCWVLVGVEAGWSGPPGGGARGWPAGRGWRGGRRGGAGGGRWWRRGERGACGSGGVRLSSRRTAPCCGSATGKLRSESRATNGMGDGWRVEVDDVDKNSYQLSVLII